MTLTLKELQKLLEDKLDTVEEVRDNVLHKEKGK